MIDAGIIDDVCRLLIKRERPNSTVAFDDLAEQDKDILRTIARHSITGLGVSSSGEKK